MFKKKYYFILVKFPNSLRLRVEYYMYLKNKKFKLHHQLHSDSLLNFWQAMWWDIKFRIAAKLGNNEKYFAYKTKVSGRIFLQKIIIAK